MAHYAFLDENNVVVEVITGVNESTTENLPNGFDSWEQWYGEFKGMTCKRTSYNTKGGKHYSRETGKWSKGRQFRGNYAGIGYIYDEELDAFYAPKPYESWEFNAETYTWEAPVPYPDDDKIYNWDESIRGWVLNEAYNPGDS